MEFTLLWAALFAVGAGWLADRRINPIDRQFDYLLGAAMVGLLVGRLAAMALGGSAPWRHPSLILLVRAGVHPGFAGAAGLGYLLWAFRDKRAQLATVAVPALVALGAWEAGCLVRQSCDGVVINATPLPIGVIVGIGLFVAAAANARLPDNIRPGAALLLGGSIRLVAEPYRSALNHQIAWWYVGAIVVGLGWIIRHRGGSKSTIPV